MSIFIGPMSLNVVDTAIDFSLKNPDLQIVFIPSRRQVEFCGGYVNNWTTADFCEYVKHKNPNILIERDHSGPGQGSFDDDGYVSLKEDTKYMDIIHVDPWKKYPNIQDGIKWTIDMILFCHSLNPAIEYEIGTEEAIRPFSVEELEFVITEIQKHLRMDIFDKIKYLVIQCGTKLQATTNTGLFDDVKLKHMLILTDKYNFKAKEHNGDWVPKQIVEQKYNIGLKYVNVAPEYGEIETNVLLSYIKSSVDYDSIYNICLKSEKWRKWVDSDFVPEINKDKLIRICCHYVFSKMEFLHIKHKYINIDLYIKNALIRRLENAIPFSRTKGMHVLQ